MTLRLWRRALGLTLLMLVGMALFPQAAGATGYPNRTDLGLNVKSAVLMDVGTGSVLYVQNPDEALPPASVTKVMTLLLIYEAQAAGRFGWDDPVTISAHAAGMGGSQLWLEVGETQTAADLTKCIAIASANDAAVAMAEFVAGSEDAFVEQMNRRAEELGMTGAHFVNACGLDAPGHQMSARDIALVSRELLARFPEVTEYTTTWMDSITHKTRRGESEFGLTNTNKMLRQYEGTTGLKTGSTTGAGFCFSGSARRNGLHLVAVVMGAADPKTRFGETMRLLDYGFANYYAWNGDPAGTVAGQVPVEKGRQAFVKAVTTENAALLLPKEQAGQVETKTELLPGLAAPVEAGTEVGVQTLWVDGKEVGRVALVAGETLERATLGDMAGRLLRAWTD